MTIEIQLPAYTAPIGDPPAWDAVMDRAGDRCECTGACGRTHSRSEFRCDRLYGHGGIRLQVAPADLTLSLNEAARVPVADLRAWCPDCHRLARRRQNERARAFARFEPTTDAAPTLFDL